jgi:hypothetical protein
MSCGKRYAVQAKITSHDVRSQREHITLLEGIFWRAGRTLPLRAAVMSTRPNTKDVTHTLPEWWGDRVVLVMIGFVVIV